MRTLLSVLGIVIKTDYSYNWPYCSCCKTHIFQRYTMDSDPRGAVLIINNRRFENNHKERLGTEQDCRNLKLLFEELGFDVYVKEDLKSFVSHFGDFFFISPFPLPKPFCTNF